MSIRVKVFLVISAIVVLITAANMGMGMLFTQSRLLETVESDMTAVVAIADELVTSKMNLLKADATAVAQKIINAGPDKLRQAMEEQVKINAEYMAITVFDREKIIASYGTAPAPFSMVGSVNLDKAFAGGANITTTRRDRITRQLVSYICVPMGSNVMTVTVSGMIFSDFLRDFRIWETGNIFMLDSSGVMISNYRREMVLRRDNYITLAKTDPSLERMGAFYEQMIKGGKGSGFYSYLGVERLCVYSEVTGSNNGWVLGVAAPLRESPATQVQQGLMIAAAFFLLIGVACAMGFSNSLAKPFERIEEQNANLIELGEVAKNASEAKSRFLANMSHEMRTPLNAVVGLSELMMDSDGTQEDTNDGLRKIHNAGMTLLNIVNDILDISKIESGKFELMPVEYDVPSLINDTVTLNIMRIADKPIKFNIHIEADMPSRLYGDELRLKQVFNNLISNAFKYTRQGQVDWYVSCERDGDDIWFTTKVKDTGIGIKAEDMKKLFSDYNQVDTKSNRKIEGTGLGLSVTRMMVNMMEGDISVESEYGKGSVFTARFKQKFVTEEPIGEKVAENLKHFNYSDNKLSNNAKLVRIKMPYAKVLVVDDVRTNLDVAKGMLKPYGMQVDCAEGGREAVNIIKSEAVKYNAIFMDHMMPEIDGIEATRIIRQEIGTEYAKNIPIIALTANAIIGNEKMFIENGFQAFISKPIDIMQLDTVVRQWVRDKDAEKALELGGHGDGPEAGDAAGQAVAQEAYGAPAAEGAPAALDIPNIEGIDVGRCVERFGGDAETAMQVLHSYVANTMPLLKAASMPEEGKLMEYAVIVHGIKGSSRGICAEETGDLAEALEHAAKAGDMGFVMMNNGRFIAETEKLLERMEAALGEVDAKNAKPVKDAPDAALLRKLAKCCGDYDMDGVDEAMAELESYSYQEQGETVAWLKEKIDAMEFMEVCEKFSPSGEAEGRGCTNIA
ncbi:MAG: response regulator [Clostridiales Family XIII bacterium]|jgi:signal transduction histidine kinase/AmiR/NasT family two-component response regulator|nr:response regulator [Clostridiales Family XIII bacterium]